MPQLYAYVAKLCVFFPVRIAFVSMLNVTCLDEQDKPLYNNANRSNGKLVLISGKEKSQ